MCGARRQPNCSPEPSSAKTAGAPRKSKKTERGVVIFFMGLSRSSRAAASCGRRIQMNLCVVACVVTRDDSQISATTFFQANPRSQVQAAQSFRVRILSALTQL